MKQTSISIIGIDIDFYTRSKKKQKQYLANLRERIFPFGVIIHDKPSQHGHHFKVKLNRKVSFWRSIEKDICRAPAGALQISSLIRKFI